MFIQTRLADGAPGAGLRDPDVPRATIRQPKHCLTDQYFGTSAPGSPWRATFVVAHCEATAARFCRGRSRHRAIGQKPSVDLPKSRHRPTKAVAAASHTASKCQAVRPAAHRKPARVGLDPIRAGFIGRTTT
jgi:hypothetical protein